MYRQNCETIEDSASDPEALPMQREGVVDQLLLRGSVALECDGDLRTARDSFEAAYQAAEAQDDGIAMAVAALGLGGLWVHEHRSSAIAVLLEARLHRALITVDPRSTLALRLRARLTAESDYRAGNHDAILAIVEEARQTGDPVAAAEASSLAHHCVLGPDHSALRHRLARQLIADAFRTGRRSDLAVGLLWRAVDCLLDADPHAERYLTELNDLLRSRDHLAVGYVMRAIDVMRSIRAGHLEQAEHRAAECAERGQAAGDADATGWYNGHILAIRWYQGRITELLPVLREVVKSPTLSVVDNSYVAALAVAAATAGDRREATGALARLGGSDLAGVPRSSSWLVSMYGIVEAAYLLRSPETAAAAYHLLLPYAHLPMMASLGVTCFGSVQHALGVASLATGDPDRAVGHLRAAVHDNLAIAHWPAVAMSRARLAQALILRAGPGDAAEAEREHGTAVSETARLGVALPGGGRGADRQVLTCQRRGRQWRLGFGHRTALVDDSRGMQYLAILLANPGHEIAAIDLAAGYQLADGKGAGKPAGLAQPVLDKAAMRDYRRRLAQLDTEIDEGERNNDLGRAAKARAEREWLVAELSSAVGIGGRARHFPTDEERARISVGKAIRRAVERVTAVEPIIGVELQATVRTGLRCSYSPR